MSEQNTSAMQQDLSNLTPTETRMATQKLSTLVLQYSLPTVLGMLINALYNVVDRFWVGQLEGVGSLALTGVGLVLPISNLIMGFAQLVGIGAASRISLSLGQKDRAGAQKILNNALVLALLFSVLVTIIGLAFAEPLLRLVGASDATLPYALSYGRIIIGGSVFNLTSFALNHSIRATGNPKRFASTQLLGAAVNMILDPIFIRLFDMGTAGVGYATIIAQAVSAIWVFSFYSSPKSELRFKKSLLKLDRKITLTILSIGLSPFLMQVSASVVNSILNNSLRFYGELDLGLGGGDLAVGAMTLINSVTIFFFMPVIGINQGVQPIVGFNYGRKDYARAKGAFKWGAVYATIICCFGFVMIQLFASRLAAFFTSQDQQLIDISARGMKTFLFCLPIIGFQSTSANFFQAIGRARISIILSALRQIVLLVPLYILLPRFMGLYGIWYAGPIADFCAAVLTGVCIIREFKIINRAETEMVEAAAY